MKYSVTVEYALHSLVHLINLPDQKTIGIKELAEFQGLSETYLSKVFSKLSKAGIVLSIPGVNGGYRLAKAATDITFWHVIRAIEGPKPIFQCKNLVAGTMIKDENTACSGCESNSFCLINQTMLEAEQQMKHFLNKKTLQWMHEELENILPEEQRQATRAYFLKE